MVASGRTSPAWSAGTVDWIGCVVSGLDCVKQPTASSRATTERRTRKFAPRTLFTIQYLTISRQSGQYATQLVRADRARRRRRLENRGCRIDLAAARSDGADGLARP